MTADLVGTLNRVDVGATPTVGVSVAAGAATVTLVLKAGAAKSAVLIDSDEAASNKPQLVVQSGGVAAVNLGDAVKDAIQGAAEATTGTPAAIAASGPAWSTAASRWPACSGR